MKKLAVVLAAAGALAATGIASPKPAEARGFGPALAGGLIAGAVIGGIASSAYARGPYDSYAAAPGYYGGPAYGYGPAYAAPYGYGYYGYGYGSRDQSKRGGQPDYNR